MQIQVTGKHVDVGEALRARVTDELSSRIAKYFDREGNGGEVVVYREGGSFKVDCSVTLANGQQMSTHGLGGDAHMAFDAALQKMEKRVRRYTRRLKDHHQQAQAKQAETAAYFVIQASDDDDTPEEDETVTGFPEPVVIAETQKQIRTLTVAMAVMELDLTESQTIVFRNAAHGGFSVVYRRPDGNIGWIDPERSTGANGTAKSATLGGAADGTSVSH